MENYRNGAVFHESKVASVKILIAFFSFQFRLQEFVSALHHVFSSEKTIFTAHPLVFPKPLIDGWRKFLPFLFEKFFRYPTYFRLMRPVKIHFGIFFVDSLFIKFVKRADCIRSSVADNEAEG